MAPSSLPILASVLLTFLLGVELVTGAAVTLYNVERPPVNVNTAISLEQGYTIRVSALGPGQDGMTRYAQEYVQSRMVLHQSDTTVTILDEPVTLNMTFEQGTTQDKASYPITVVTHAHGHLVRIGSDGICSLDIPNGRGSCVEVVEDARIHANGGDAQNPSFTTSVTTFTTTYTGSLQPFATIDPESTIPANPTPTTSGARSIVGSRLMLVTAALSGLAVLFIL